MEFCIIQENMDKNNFVFLKSDSNDNGYIPRSMQESFEICEKVAYELDDFEHIKAHKSRNEPFVDLYNESVDLNNTSDTYESVELVKDVLNSTARTVDTLNSTADLEYVLNSSAKTDDLFDRTAEIEYVLNGTAKSEDFLNSSADLEYDHLNSTVKTDDFFDRTAELEYEKTTAELEYVFNGTAKTEDVLNSTAESEFHVISNTWGIESLNDYQTRIISDKGSNSSPHPLYPNNWSSSPKKNSPDASLGIGLPDITKKRFFPPSYLEKSNFEQSASSSIVKSKVIGLWNNLKYGWNVNIGTNLSKQIPIQMLGGTYRLSPPTDCREDNSEYFEVEAFKEAFYSIPWFTYRTKLSPFITNTAQVTETTSDCGWGCTLRCTQMMFCLALNRRFLGSGGALFRFFFFTYFIFFLNVY